MAQNLKTTAIKRLQQMESRSATISGSCVHVTWRKKGKIADTSPIVNRDLDLLKQMVTTVRTINQERWRSDGETFEVEALQRRPAGEIVRYLKGTKKGKDTVLNTWGPPYTWFQTFTNSNFFYPSIGSPIESNLPVGGEGLSSLISGLPNTAVIAENVRGEAVYKLTSTVEGASSSTAYISYVSQADGVELERTVARKESDGKGGKFEIIDFYHPQQFKVVGDGRLPTEYFHTQWYKQGQTIILLETKWSRLTFSNGNDAFVVPLGAVFLGVAQPTEDEGGSIEQLAIDINNDKFDPNLVKQVIDDYQLVQKGNYTSYS